MANLDLEHDDSYPTDANLSAAVGVQKACAFEATDAWLSDVAFNADGLVPAIAQDKDSGDILMLAWMNKEALQQTAQTKTAIYFSRSRGTLWRKGETSGHTQHVHEMYLDCDADAIVLKVTQVGAIACHTGRRSCFYRRLALSSGEPKWHTFAPILKDPSAIYGASQQPLDIGLNADPSHMPDTPRQVQASDVLNQLDAILAERKQASADSSYVASLYAKGINKILEKVGEEAIETVLAAKDLAAANDMVPSDIDPRQMPGISYDTSSTIATEALVDDLVYEIADVWFHTVVTLAWFNVKSERVLIELARRFGLSGIEEKNSR